MVGQEEEKFSEKSKCTFWRDRYIVKSIIPLKVYTKLMIDESRAGETSVTGGVDPKLLGFELLEENERHPSAPKPKKISYTRDQCECKRY